MRALKSYKKYLIFAIIITMLTVCLIAVIPERTLVAEAATNNKVTTRVSGTLNGILKKEENGSITFNGNEIASAEENLLEMYVILQGAGGAGGYDRGILVQHNILGGGGSGAFAFVKISFAANDEYLLSSGAGANEKINNHFGMDTSITYINTTITAKAGESACNASFIYEDSTHNETIARGGSVIVDGTLNDSMTLLVQKEGQNAGRRSPAASGGASVAFTISMYKNNILTTKFFGHKVGGLTQVTGGAGGGASPYGRGGNGQYSDYIFGVNILAEDGYGYGAGGGGAISNMFTHGNGVGGSGGDGFIEILG